jgi:hypothetical protein
MKSMNWPERVAYLENQLADSDRDNKRLQGLLTRIHGIAAEPRPVNMAVRLENIACIASGGRDVTYAQLAEAQRLPHSAPAMCNHFPGQSTCEWCGAVQPEKCCLDYPRCDCNSPPEPDNAPTLQPCGHPWKAQHDSKCILCSSPGSAL